MATTKTEPRNAALLGEVLTLEEAAAYLRVPEESVLRLATDKELPGRKVGEEWRFSKSALEAWLRQGGVAENGWIYALPPFFGVGSLELLLAELERRLLLKLSPPEPPPQPRSSKEKLLALAGKWKDDPTVDALLEGIYERRRQLVLGDEE